MTERLITGIVRSSHGRYGELSVSSLSGETEHFSSLKEICLKKGKKEVCLKVESIRTVSGKVLIKFEGIDSIDQAREYRGWELLIDREEGPDQGKNEYFIADLCGCTMYYNGEPIGIIGSVWSTGHDDLLEVVKSEEESFWIPFREVFIGKVDIKKKSIEMKDGWQFT